MVKVLIVSQNLYSTGKYRFTKKEQYNSHLAGHKIIGLLKQFSKSDDCSKTTIHVFTSKFKKNHSAFEAMDNILKGCVSGIVLNENFFSDQLVEDVQVFCDELKSYIKTNCGKNSVVLVFSCAAFLSTLLTYISTQEMYLPQHLHNTFEMGDFHITQTEFVNNPDHLWKISI